MPKPQRIFLKLLAFSISCYAQLGTAQDSREIEDSSLLRQQAVEAARTAQPRQLNILTPTIAPEEIDRAVLNRLMQEIARSPEITKTRLGVDDNQLQDIFIATSNARNFINDSEMANVRAMCNSWKNSTLDGDAKINEALDAYKARQAFTIKFIARYYSVVLADIESLLSEPALHSFTSYMNDRRRRMANSGAAAFGAVVQNINNGLESIEFHCHQ